MANYPYTQVPGKLKTLLAKAREIGIPTKVTAQWLKTIGYKSSNDYTLLPVLKFIGFLDDGGVPTQRWKMFRGSDHKKVLAEAIRIGYSDLYSLYPDADQRSQSELEHVFSTSSSAGKQVVAKTVTTFKALTSEADFSEPGASLHADGPLHAPVAEQPKAKAPQAAPHPEAPSVHIDIQVHIAPESSPEQIDQIFASMARHLYGRTK